MGGVGDGNDVPTQDLVSQGYKTARVVDGSYELELTKQFLYISRLING